MKYLRTVSTALCLLSAFGQASPPEPEIEPALRALLSRSAEDPRALLRAAEDPEALRGIPRSVIEAFPSEAPGAVDLFMETAAPLPPVEGALVIPLPAGRAAVRATPEAIRTLLATGAVRSAHLSRPVREALDRSTDFIGLPAVRRQDMVTGNYSGASGEGVVVGIVDSGLDFAHPDFQNRDHRSRLAWYWDQRAPGGTPTLEVPFGRAWSGSTIDQGVAEGVDRTGHGTHVLGIAAGNGKAAFVPGRGTSLSGVAPEATIVAVRANLTEYGVAVGVQYILERARELGMPAVVNLSLGNHFGPHKGQTAFERVLESFVEPGRLIVAAAGNDGHLAFHAEARVSKGQKQVLEVRFPDYRKDQDTFVFMDFEGWFDLRDDLSFTVFDPEGRSFGPILMGTEERSSSTSRGFMSAWHTEEQDRGRFLLEIEDNPTSIRRAVGTWRVEIESEGDREAEIDFWLVNWRTNTQDYPEFLTHVDREETILVPATADSLIAVGAVSTRACWTDTRGAERCYTTPPVFGQVAFFSSLGPTSDGRAKPEILAPGFGIVSCRAGDISPEIWTSDELALLGTPDGRYWLSQGTSMAAPHVTGTVALLLQRFPDLTIGQAIGRLREAGRSVTDARSGRVERILASGESVAPSATLLYDEVTVLGGAHRIFWSVGRSVRRPVSFRVYRGFSEEGPFHELSAARIEGSDPYTITDLHPEPGREHLYRITTVDGSGIEEDLDTLRVAVPGSPVPALRPPDPNPARDAVSLRFFLPPSDAGGEYAIQALDVQGRLVKEVASGRFDNRGEEGLATWDLSDRSGHRVPSGVYLIRLFHRTFQQPTTRAEEGISGQETRRIVVLP